MEIQGTSNALPDVCVEPLHGEGASKLFRVFRRKGDFSHVLDAPHIVTALIDYFEKGYYVAICKTEKEHIVYSQAPKGIRISRESIQEHKAKESDFRYDVKYMIQSPNIRTILTELGILSTEGTVRREQYDKLIEIKNFVEVIYKILPRFKGQEHLNIVDGACGKSYLSFILYHLLREEWGIDARFQCIDTNDRLITRCQDIQNALSFRHMQFVVSSINEFTNDRNVDVLYSLHGCDTATDEAIAAGVHLNSQVILVVPCCHFELRGQLRQHPLKGITKYGLFEEKFAALLTDSLRALALEAMGYDVATFRFVTDDISPKNTLLRASKRQHPNQQALQQYRELRDMFGISPSIERLLPLRPARH
jgi:hypothetical protein